MREKDIKILSKCDQFKLYILSLPEVKALKELLNPNSEFQFIAFNDKYIMIQGGNLEHYENLKTRRDAIYQEFDNVKIYEVPYLYTALDVLYDKLMIVTRPQSPGEPAPEVDQPQGE